MHRYDSHPHRWGVILAGGDGVRLRPLTKLVTGDERPKQFCPLIDGRTLLSQTRLRVSDGIPFDRTLHVLCRDHERFYRRELADVSKLRMVEQPSNRGTLPAILWGLLRVAQLDPNATLAFFPSDHYYADERKFMEGLEDAFVAAEIKRDSMVLLGASATHPETEYGWIEPEPPNHNASVFELLPKVRRFWEKPSFEVAQGLHGRGCLWNTFVMVGSVQAFLDMVRTATPGLLGAFEMAFAMGGTAVDHAAMEVLYDQIAVTDFSRRVLAVSIDRLLVLPLGEVGWSDLGDPGRVISTLRDRGLPSPWSDYALSGSNQLKMVS